MDNMNERIVSKIPKRDREIESNLRPKWLNEYRSSMLRKNLEYSSVAKRGRNP